MQTRLITCSVNALFGLLALYVIPMGLLIEIMASFLVDRASSEEREQLVALALGIRPVFMNHEHAVMSLRVIWSLELVLAVLAVFVETVVCLISRSRVSITFHVVAAWLIGFLSSFAHWFLRWIRYRVEGRGPLSIEILRAISFACTFALIALIVIVLLNGIWEHLKQRTSESGSLS